MEVKAVVDCYVDNTYRVKGERFDYSGPKNENLQPVKPGEKPQLTLAETEDEK